MNNFSKRPKRIQEKPVPTKDYCQKTTGLVIKDGDTSFV